MYLLRIAAIVALFVSITGRRAHADGIVLESYTGNRPADTKLLAPVLEELATRGFVGGYDAVGRKFEAQASRPVLSPEGLPAKFTAQIDAANTAWLGAKFDQAVQLLSPLVVAAHANPGTFAQNQALREQLLKALIVLALAQQRTGDPSAARETFGEILRSYPEMILSRATYGPQAFDLFEQARKDVAGTRGKLTIKVSDDSAVVYVDEKLENQGMTVKNDIPPGDYRVFARVGKQMSRCHIVKVKANGEFSVTVDMAFDAAVRSGPAWTGLGFATAAEREEHEAGYAAAFANAIDAHAVAVVGIDQVHGRPAVVGALINLVTGREIRRASIALEPAPQPDRLRALARFLAGDEPTGGIDVIINGEGQVRPTEPVAHDVVTHAPEHPVDSGAPHGRWNGWKWALGGVGGAAIITGGVLLYLDGKCSSMPPDPMLPCRDNYNFVVPGSITLAGGVILGGIATYLFLTDDKAPQKTAYVAPLPGGAMFGYASSF